MLNQKCIIKYELEFLFGVDKQEKFIGSKS